MYYFKLISKEEAIITFRLSGAEITEFSNQHLNFSLRLKCIKRGCTSIYSLFETLSYLVIERQASCSLAKVYSLKSPN